VTRTEQEKVQEKGKVRRRKEGG